MSSQRASHKDTLKPDLILLNEKDKVAIVLDPTIVADDDPARPNNDVLAESDQGKVQKYSCPQVEQWITNRLGTPPALFKVVGVAVNWRGIVSPGAIENLRTGVLSFSSHLITLLSIRTLTGGWSIWNARRNEATS